ncbi:YncE family protein [Peribacillus sp. NPDC097295]|uniref:YncE family protein n=1 Tax=Peribacillus sp. NPDC097295 TaxID=3364402 RepID=UPI003823FA24
MRQVIVLLFAVILLGGCNSSDTYTKVNLDKSFLATVNIKDTSLTFLDENYQRFARWDISEPFTGALLLADKDTVLLYGKEMATIEVYSLSAGKHIDSWKAGKGIVNMLLLHNGEGIVAVNQLNHSIYFFDEEGKHQERVKVGESPLTVLQGKLGSNLYVINFGDTLCSVIDLETKQVDREFTIQGSSTGALLREEQREIWIGGHGEGNQVEENLYMYSTETGKMKGKLKVPTMPIKFIENEDGIFILSHGTSSLYKMNDKYEEIKSLVVGVNPFEMGNFKGDLIVAGYDSDKVYIVNTDTMDVKQTVEVGEGPFQMMIRE